MLTRNAVGEGKAYYLATCANESFLTDFYAALAAEAGITPLAAQVDDTVEVLAREADDRTLLFVLNHANTDQTTDLGEQSGTDLLTGDPCSGVVTLAPYAVRIVQLD